MARAAPHTQPDTAVVSNCIARRAVTLADLRARCRGAPSRGASRGADKQGAEGIHISSSQENKSENAEQNGLALD